MTHRQAAQKADKEMQAKAASAEIAQAIVRNMNEGVGKMICAAVEAEREACAKAVLDLPFIQCPAESARTVPVQDFIRVLDQAAAAIRARSQKDGGK